MQFPFLTAGGDNSLGYDLKIVSANTFTITYPADPVEISAPDAALLNS